ncbi:MAG: sigma 54-interacting transcriptional regulator [Deltaproteobacteria bacterium]|nr:sigma 54-interacting transcriptional regulator [Deltaproteobacteria bacterium]
MPYLTVMRRGDIILKFPCTKTIIRIGRDPASDLQLHGDTISRLHCLLEWDGTAYRVTDRSRNGLLLNGKPPTEPMSLAQHSLLAIGEWELRYDDGPLSAPVDTVLADPRSTRILRYDPAAKALLVKYLHLAVALPSGTVAESKHDRLPIAFGSAPTHAVVVADDPYVSRTHCVIEIGADGPLLRDAGSRNGTWWKGARVAAQPLGPSGEFLIGKTRVSYRIVEAAEPIKPARKKRCGEMLGAGRPMQEVFGLVERIGPCDAPVLIHGESGTGKELCARAIHAASSRANRPFIAVNCGALPATIIESELFGHERGAFTGATTQHRGVFEQTAGGTLFLDEIGEMPPELQSRLLRVLETRTVRRVGGTADCAVDFRLVAATHRDLQTLVGQGRFREDLFYRLYVVPLRMPPLRERPEDVDLLTDHYVELFGGDRRRVVCSPAAREALHRYPWPGNVRELRNTIQRAMLLAGAETLQPEHLVFAPAQPSAPHGAGSLDEQERRAIQAALAATKGNHSKAARQLGIARTTLVAKLKRFGITTHSD